MTHYFSWLLPCFLIAAGLIAVDAAFPALPFWFGFAPVVPLVAYHFILRFRRGQKLRPAEVDSVYYLGFLITVAALAAAAFQLAGSDHADTASVLERFGAGVFATGYAVLARLHLQGVAGSELTTSPEQALDSYLVRSGVMLDNLEMAILRIGSLSETAMSETQRVAAKSQELLEAKALSTATAFDTALQGSLKSVSDNVERFRALLTDSSFLAEREAFAAAVRASVGVAAELNAVLETLTSRARVGGDSLEQMRGATASLAASSEALNGQLAELSGQEGALSRTATHVEEAARGSQRTAELAQAAARGIATIVAKVGKSADALGALGESASAAGDRLVSVSAASDRLSSSVEQLADAGKVLETVAAGVHRVGTALPELAPRVQKLAAELEGLTTTLASAASSLEADAHRSSRAVGLLTENLGELAETIVERTQERQAGV